MGRRNKQEEKHITVTPETHEKLQKIAKSQRRSMRAVVTKWVEEAEGGSDGSK